MSEDPASKSAKRRAAKKARDAAGDSAPAPATAPAPAPKAETKPKAEAKPKAKAESKPKAQAKPAGKKAEPQEEEQPKPKKKEEEGPPTVKDDGQGGSWDVVPKGKKGKNKPMGGGEPASKGDLAKKDTIQKQNQAVPGAAGPSAAQVKATVTSASQLVGASAKDLAKDKVEGEAAAPGEKKETLSIECPEEKIGRVIGPKGVNLAKITEKSGCDRIDTSGEGVFTVMGSAESVKIAEAALRELIEKGYMSLAYDDFAEMSVLVHPSCFPDLIGKGGAIIQAIKKELGCEINIPKTPENASKLAKKYPVGIAGSKEASEKCKAVVEHISWYGYSQVTHPDQTHEELEIEYWNYSYVIGKQGCELRHIQKTYGVKVNIPRDHSAIQNVVLVGEKRDIDRAKIYMEKLITRANEPRGRGAADKADDHFGQEADEEDWMKQYMYKRPGK